MARCGRCGAVIFEKPVLHNGWHLHPGCAEFIRPTSTDSGTDNVTPIDWAPSLRWPLSGGSAA